MIFFDTPDFFFFFSFFRRAISVSMMPYADAFAEALPLFMLTPARHAYAA